MYIHKYTNAILMSNEFSKPLLLNLIINILEHFYTVAFVLNHDVNRNSND